MDFPANPTVGQLYTFGDKTWQCTVGGATPRWISVTAYGPQGTTGSQGLQGLQGTIGATPVDPITISLLYGGL